MTALPYAYEKFMGAVNMLATSARPLQKRLVSAALGIRTLKSDDFPAGELRDGWEAIYERLTREGSFEATMAKMSDEDASKVATMIWDMFSELGGIATLRMR
jgi:hypothetical protein